MKDAIELQKKLDEINNALLEELLLRPVKKEDDDERPLDGKNESTNR